jgi:alpha-beta hydrolase superfamily lysophospholipase
MKHQDGFFLGREGYQLYYQTWYPKSSARAVVVLLHGLGSHSGLFSTVVNHLVHQRYIVCGFDLRGHGRSTGQRGYINRWSEFREDLQGFLQFIKTQQPTLPLFLLGHSLGSIIALDYALHAPENLRGVIMLAPPLGKVGVPSIRLQVGKALSRVWPRFTLNTGMDRAASSRNPTIVEAYEQDLLRHTKATARLATEFLSTIRWIETHVHELRIPILMLHGTADRIAPPWGSRVFFQHILFPDKERHEYLEAYHDLHNDPSYPDMLRDLSDWLTRHLDTSPPLCHLETQICCLATPRLVSEV